jgi:hypothetical protein
VQSRQLVAENATEGKATAIRSFAANGAGMRAVGFRMRIAYHFATGDPPEEQGEWSAPTSAARDGRYMTRPLRSYAVPSDVTPPL